MITVLSHVSLTNRFFISFCQFNSHSYSRAVGLFAFMFASHCCLPSEGGPARQRSEARLHGGGNPEAKCKTVFTEWKTTLEIIGSYLPSDFFYSFRL